MTVIFDEELMLQSEQLDEIRLLTSADMDATSPFACLLVGLAHPPPTHETRGVRRARPTHLTALRTHRHDPEETASYVEHHTGLAGPHRHPLQRGRHQPDPPNLQGLPRAVNNLAVQALLAAYATNTGIVNESSAPQAVKETTG